MRANHRVRADPINNPVPFVAFSYPQNERVFTALSRALAGWETGLLLNIN